MANITLFMIEQGKEEALLEEWDLVGAGV